MRNLRTDSSVSPVKWTEEEVMAYLGCDKSKAKEIMDDCRKEKAIEGYGPIEKELLLDYINQKQRIEREREARHNADIATARQVAVLEEQVKTLQKICDSSSADAAKARTQSLIANFISAISLIIALLALILR